MPHSMIPFCFIGSAGSPSTLEQAMSLVALGIPFTYVTRPIYPHGKHDPEMDAAGEKSLVFLTIVAMDRVVIALDGGCYWDRKLYQDQPGARYKNNTSKTLPYPVKHKRMCCGLRGKFERKVSHETESSIAF